MANTQKDGGNAVPKGSGARLSDTPRCSLIAVPIAGTKEPQVFTAKNMDDFLGQVPQTFKVQLRRADGSASKEAISFRKFDDLDLANISLGSETLREQQFQKDFLHRFLHEWKENPAFRQEIQQILADPERKAGLISAFRQIGSALKNAQSPLAALMNQ